MEPCFDILTPAKVADLRVRDPAITAIRQRRDSGDPVSFDWLRKRLMRENGLREDLDWGRAILSSTYELDQYLWNHGPMIESQWYEVCSWPIISLKRFQLIDYGCGQGLAGLLLVDRLGLDLVNLCAKVVLIEPSRVALTRAEAVYHCIFPDSSIYCVGKKFDELSTNDLASNRSLETLHVFSNVLDIKGFDLIDLFRKALCNGKHTVLAVSHDRNHNGGTDRINDLKAELERPELKPWISISRNESHKFRCTNPRQSKAIGWILQLEITNA